MNRLGPIAFFLSLLSLSLLWGIRTEMESSARRLDNEIHYLKSDIRGLKEKFMESPPEPQLQSKPKVSKAVSLYVKDRDSIKLYFPQEEFNLIEELLVKFNDPTVSYLSVGSSEESYQVVVKKEVIEYIEIQDE